MKDFSHIDKKGNAQMVDITEKNKTSRQATAKGLVKMKKETLNQIKNKKMKKDLY